MAPQRDSGAAVLERPRYALSRLGSATLEGDPRTLDSAVLDTPLPRPLPVLSGTASPYPEGAATYLQWESGFSAFARMADYWHRVVDNPGYGGEQPSSQRQYQILGELPPVHHDPVAELRERLEEWKAFY